MDIEKTEIRQIEDLNDVFAIGDLEVWYLRPDCFRDYGVFGSDPSPTALEATHILLGKIAPSPGESYSVDEFEGAWQKLQGEFWSPNGEANSFIRSCGLRHTSMSVGDCFRLDGNVYRVESCGFRLL